MRKLAGVMAVVAMLGGCLRYQPKRISLPQTEEASQCASEALSDYDRCVINQQGRAYCAKLRDTRLLRCPGAKEEAVAEKSGDDPQLPGYHP